MAKHKEGDTGRGRVARQRNVRPIVALATEGLTEKNHSLLLAQRYPVRVRPRVFDGSHGKKLVDEAATYAEDVKAQHPDAEVVSAAIYDLENTSNKSWQLAVETNTYAESKGVLLFVNAPTIERWFVLCLGHKSINASPRVINRELATLIEQHGLPPYKKPGSPLFHLQLMHYIDDAMERCKQAGHLGELPCMCLFVELVRSFDGASE